MSQSTCGQKKRNKEEEGASGRVHRSGTHPMPIMHQRRHHVPGRGGGVHIRELSARQAEIILLHRGRRIQQEFGATFKLKNTNDMKDATVTAGGGHHQPPPPPPLLYGSE